MLFSTSLAVFQRAAAFGPDAPLGTGLEWMTLAALVLPALLLILLVYGGQQSTV